MSRGDPVCQKLADLGLVVIEAAGEVQPATGDIREPVGRDQVETFVRVSTPLTKKRAVLTVGKPAAFRMSAIAPPGGRIPTEAS